MNLLSEFSTKRNVLTNVKKCGNIFLLNQALLLEFVAYIHGKFIDTKI